MKLKLAKDFYIGSSVLVMLLGVLFLLGSRIAVQTECLFAGIIILLVGVSKVFGYFSDRLYNIAFQFDLSIGLLTVLLGTAFLVLPHRASPYLTSVLAVFVIVNAVFTVQNAVESRRFGIHTWWVLLFGAVPAVILGFLTLLRFLMLGTAQTALLGLALLLDGIENLIVAFITISTAQHSSEGSYEEGKE